MNGEKMIHPKAQDVFKNKLAKNHTTRISCQREKLKCYVESS